MSIPSKEVLDRIRKNGQQVRSVALNLTNQIKNFEAWLVKIPGRVAADHKMWTSETGEEEGYLAFRKQGSEWALVVYEYLTRQDHEHNATLLRDAPIETKVRAVKHFPALMEAIAKRQEEVIKEAKESSHEYEAIAKDYGIGEGL